MKCTLSVRGLLKLAAIPISIFFMSVDSLSSSDTPENRAVLNVEPTKALPRNSEGSFATLASGRIIFYYSQFYGGNDDHSAACIVGIHSDDKGVTWSKPTVILENSGAQNIMSVSLLRLKSGKLALFYLRRESWQDCRPCMQVSTNDGATWSEPRRVLEAPGYFIINNDRAIQTESGRVILPLAFHRSRSESPLFFSTWDGRGIAMWLYSDDDGTTWKEAKDYWAIPKRTENGLQEPGVVEIGNGSLLTFCRTDTGTQYGMTSTDDGNTWTPPEPMQMTSPLSPASIKRIPGTEKLLAIFNDHSGKFPHTPGARTPLVAAVSSDHGQTWRNSKLLEGDLDGWYCYTAIHFVDNAVLLSYCAGDSKVGGLNRLRMRRVDLAWLP